MEEKEQSAQAVLINPLIVPAPVEEKKGKEKFSKPQEKKAIKHEGPKIGVAEAEKMIKKDYSDSNMVVAIRVRPLSIKEIGLNEFNILSIEDKLLVVHDPRELESETEIKRLDVLHRSKEQRFFFDRIFRDKSQEEVYQRTCANLVRPVLQGFNATVFAYGTTGSGKTYTMVGTPENPGIMALTLRDMFQFISEDSEREYELKVSYVEIYNEIIHDLLVSNSKDTYLELRDDPLKSVTIAGVTETKVEDSKHVMNLLLHGNKRRTTEATNANVTSSRSHAVFQIMVSSKDKIKNTGMEMLCGKLSLIDLAGSERGSVTENRGQRLIEGSKINRSLLSLANCINALGDKQKKGFFVPYRDSKLTRMLKDSLGGNCKTVMIATISPASAQYEETVNTLKYASRAKNIKIKSIPNKKLVLMHISAYKHIISDLRDEIERLKANKKTGVSVLSKIHPEAPVPAAKCTCGREDDLEAKLQLIKEVAAAYDEIMQLEQALIELDEQNTMNSIEIKKREAKVTLFFQSYLEKQGKLDDVDEIEDEETKTIKEQIGRQKEKITILKENTKHNIDKRHAMKGDLLESYEQIRKIRLEIPNRVKHPDTKDYLELVIKNNFLEAQNVQLLLNLQLQARTIVQLKSMIMRQQKFIQENHLDSSANMGKIFHGKQFEEIDEGEDYQRLIQYNCENEPETGRGSEWGVEQNFEISPEKISEKAEEIAETPGADPGPVEEFVGIIMGEDPDNAVVGETKEEDVAQNHTEKGISITGIPMFKVEGRGVAQPSVEKRSGQIKKASFKERKQPKLSVNPPQPTGLSILGSGISGPKKGIPGPLKKGK